MVVISITFNCECEIVNSDSLLYNASVESIISVLNLLYFVDIFFSTSIQGRFKLDTEQKKVGMETRRHVLGDDYVDKATAGATEFDQPFQDLITEFAWGRVWSRSELSKRERSMLTIALLAANGHWDEFAMHLKATANTKASAEDIREVLLHVAIYCGVPVANRAFKDTKRIFAENGLEF